LHGKNLQVVTKLSLLGLRFRGIGSIHVHAGLGYVNADKLLDHTFLAEKG
jgi:hypothetical protein